MPHRLPPMLRRVLPLTALLGGVSLLGLAGCGREEGITSYDVPKLETLQSPADRDSEPEPAGSAPRSGSTDRTIAAMVPHGDKTWFFKLSGPSEAVAAQKDEILSLLKTVKFSAAGEPTWDLPQDWEQKPASGMRYATLQIDGAGKPLELSVIPLPTTLPSYDQYILENVNRWRGELGLKPVTQEELFGGKQPSGELTQLKQDDRTITVVDLVGMRGPGDTMRPPFAGGVPPFAGGAAPEQTAADETDVTFTAPAGWTKAENDPFSRHAFVVQSEGAQGRMTVTAAGGDLLANVNRWRTQRGLSEPWSAEDLEREAQQVTVGGETGYLVHFAAPGDEPSREATLGAVVPHGGRLWFFKLTGPASLVETQREPFEAFLESVRFESK